MSTSKGILIIYGKLTFLELEIHGFYVYNFVGRLRYAIASDSRLSCFASELGIVCRSP